MSRPPRSSTTVSTAMTAGGVKPDWAGSRQWGAPHRLSPRSVRNQGSISEAGGPGAATGAILEGVAPTPPEEGRVGPQATARPTATAGDSPEGPGGEPSLAMPCGVAPRPAPPEPASATGPTGATTGPRTARRAPSPSEGRGRTGGPARMQPTGRPRDAPRPGAMRCARRHAARELCHDTIAQNRTLENGLTIRRASQARPKTCS
jgi:hypothetical protein